MCHTDSWFGLAAPLPVGKASFQGLSPQNFYGDLGILTDLYVVTFEIHLTEKRKIRENETGWNDKSAGG